MTTPATTQDVPNCGALLETAWGVIANAGGTGGNWTAETSDWQDAAARWRDDYHRWLHAHLDTDDSAV